MFKKVTAALSALLMALTVIAATPAAADDHRGWRGDRGHGYYDGPRRGYYGGGYRHHRDDNDDAIVAGVVGLALGAVLGAAITQNNERRRAEQAYRPDYAPPPQYGYQDDYRDEQRTCYRQERQWDPYANRYLWVDVPFPC